jgi:predicted transposase/invertase (TIGR01784 family)
VRKSSKSKNKSISDVTQPHDKLVKKLLSNPTVARDILSLYLPANVCELVDLNNLSLQRDSFIDDEHRAFAVDLLYKTTFQSEEGYIWILLEHQRKDDPWLPVRIFKYMATIWDHIRRTSKTYKIPLVYPLIVYNGDRPYSHTLTFRDMIEPEASKELFDTFFKTPFCLVDLAVIKDQTLKKQLQDHVSGVALLMTLKHVFDRNLQELFEHLLLDVYKQLDQSGNRDDLADMLYYLLNESEFLNEDRFWSIIHQNFSSETEGKIMTIAQKLEARGIQQGVQRVALKLIEKGEKLETVSKLTDLSIEELKKLKAKQSH